ncbi:MAG: carboxypeptidase regulatory-like domain-containing protein [Acidobacteria bacterium]|nr:MAG: carboxypeptidase regulatory-like domain-containing protein [Acidobacteriota bacterium]
MPDKRRRWLVAGAFFILVLVGLWFLRWDPKDDHKSDRSVVDLASQRNARPPAESSGRQSEPAPKAPQATVASVPVPSGEKRSSDPRLFLLQGRVVSEEGEGLAGAHLEIFLGPSSADDSPVRSLRTEKDGGYRVQLDYAEYQLIRVKAEMAGFIGREDAIQMQSQGGVRIDYTLTRFASTLSGRVIDSQGKGVAGALVRVWVPHRGRAELGSSGFIAPDLREVDSSADGSFSFANLSPGGVQLQILPKDDLPSDRNLELKPGENTVEVRLRRTETVEVRVTNRAGQPVPGCQGPQFSVFATWSRV